MSSANNKNNNNTLSSNDNNQNNKNNSNKGKQGKGDDDSLANLVRCGLIKLRQGEFYTAYNLEEHKLQHHLLMPLPNPNDKTAPLHEFLRAVSELEDETDISQLWNGDDNDDETNNSRAATRKQLSKEKLTELMNRRKEWVGLIQAFLLEGNSDNNMNYVSKQHPSPENDKDAGKVGKTPLKMKQKQSSMTLARMDDGNDADKQDGGDKETAAVVNAMPIIRRNSSKRRRQFVRKLRQFDVVKKPDTVAAIPAAAATMDDVEELFFMMETDFTKLSKGISEQQQQQQNAKSVEINNNDTTKPEKRKLDQAIHCCAAPPSSPPPPPPKKKAKQTSNNNKKTKKRDIMIKERLEQKRNQAKAEFEARKKEILETVPDEVKQRFRQIGFVKWTKTYLPVLILSPYDVPPGSARLEWMKMFQTCKKQGRLKDMTNLVYWYGTSNIDQAYSFEITKNIVKYEDGVKKGYDKVPARIQKMLDNNATLQRRDADFCKGLQDIAEDAAKDPSERMRGILNFREEYDLITMQDVLDYFEDDSDTEESDDDDEKERAYLEGKSDDPTIAPTKKDNIQLIAGSESAPTPESPSAVVITVNDMAAIGETEMSDVDDEGFLEWGPPFTEDDDDDEDDSIPMPRVKKISAIKQTNTRKLPMTITPKKAVQNDCETEKETAHPKKTRQKKQAANEVQLSNQSKEQNLTDPSKAEKRKPEKKPVSYKGSREEEQNLFDECQDMYLPLIEEWHKAIDEKNVQGLIGLMIKLMPLVDKFSASFFEAYRLNEMMKPKTRDVIVRSEPGMKMYRVLWERMKAAYVEKKKTMPDGFFVIKRPHSSIAATISTNKKGGILESMTSKQPQPTEKEDTIDRKPPQADQCEKDDSKQSEKVEAKLTDASNMTKVSASQLISPSCVPQTHLNEDGSIEHNRLEAANQAAPSQLFHALESKSLSYTTTLVPTVVPIKAEMIESPCKHPPAGDDDHGLYTVTTASDGGGAGSQPDIPDSSSEWVQQIKIESDDEGFPVPDGASEADTSILPAAVPRAVDESTTEEMLLPAEHYNEAHSKVIRTGVTPGASSSTIEGKGKDKVNTEPKDVDVLLDDNGRLFNQQVLNKYGSRDETSLHRANKKGDNRLATLLLQEHPDQNAQDQQAPTPLHLDQQQLQQQQPFIQPTSTAAAAVRQSCRDEEDKKVDRFTSVNSENHARCDNSKTTPHEVDGEDEVSRCLATNNCRSRQAGIKERVYHVADELIRDPYGDEGVYSGFMSGTTGCPHGHGTMTYQNGRNYVGEWEHGRWHGQGRLVDPNGDVYEGGFDHDARHGHGCYKWANGDAYKGDFVEGKRHGKGVFTFLNGNVYKGDLVDGLFDGKGRYDFEGGFYEGEWKSGRYEGQGHVQYLDGSSHHGFFVGGVACAEGEVVNDDNSNDDARLCHVLYTAAMVRDGRDGGGGERGTQMGDDDETDYDGESRLAPAFKSTIQNNHHRHHHTKDAQIESTLFVADGDTDHAARPATNNHHISTVAFDRNSCNRRRSTVSFAGAIPPSYQQQHDHHVAPPRRSSSNMLSPHYPLPSQPEHFTSINSVVVDKQVLQSLMDRMDKLQDQVLGDKLCEKDGEVEQLRQEVGRLQRVVLAKQTDIDLLQSTVRRHEQTIAHEKAARTRQQKLLETISCAFSNALSTTSNDEEEVRLVFASDNNDSGQPTITRQVKTTMEQQQPSSGVVGLTVEQLQQLLVNAAAAVTTTAMASFTNTTSLTPRVASPSPSTTIHHKTPSSTEPPPLPPPPLSKTSSLAPSRVVPATFDCPMTLEEALPTQTTLQQFVGNQTSREGVAAALPTYSGNSSVNNNIILPRVAVNEQEDGLAEDANHSALTKEK